MIDDQTSETNETWANPDGTLTSRIDAGPVRYDAGKGKWQDIDTSLTANDDGTYSPAAFGESIVLSDGSGPKDQPHDLLTIGSGKDAITWQWDGVLPTPTVKDDTATYADVEPGIDLVVQVRPTGVEQYFVVKQAPTTAPTFELPLKLDNQVDASTAKNGDIVFTSDDGDVIARTPSAGMWSASSDDIGAPTDSPTTVPVTLDSSGTAPVLQVDPKLSDLQDATPQNPVVVDPGVNLSTTYDTWVNAGSTSFSGGGSITDSIGPLSGSATRTFYNWDDSAILGTEVTAATLNLFNTKADSPANTWQIWRTGTVSSSTTWANQPTWTANDETTTAGNGSAAGWDSASILTTAQAWANGTASTVGMGLRTSPETGTVNQMTFSSINSSGPYPYITLTYGHYPNTPENLVVKDQHVFSTTSYANTTTPTFSADITDPDGGTENAAYTLTDTTTSTTVLNKALGTSTSGDGTSTYAVASASHLTDGDSYQLQVWGYDGTSYSQNSKTTTFTVDATAPATPTIGSSTYASNSWTNSASGGFIFSDTASDVQTWYYSYNGGAITASGSGTCSTSCTWSPTLTPPAGWDSLKVWAADKDGNVSSSVTYTFGADQSGVTSPQPSQVVSDNNNVPLAGNLTLDGTGPYAATQVTFQYQLNVTTGTWHDIPYGDVTNNGTTLTAWPVTTNQVTGGLIATAPQLSGGGPALKWAVASTLSGLSDNAQSQPIYVRAVFTNGSSQYTSPNVLMTYNSAAMDNGGSTVDAGPCTVSLWTGTCEIDASDASIDTPSQGYLGVDRTFISNSLPTTGPFGPSWTTSLPTDSADVSTLIDNNGLVTVQGPNTSLTFVPSGSGYKLSDGETGEDTLTKSGSGASTTFTFSEPSDNQSDANQSDTQQITFTEYSQPSGGPSVATPWVYKAATIEPTGPAGSAQQTQYIYWAATGYPREVLAPQPSGPGCDVTWTVGCEKLTFTYDNDPNNPSLNPKITKVTLNTADSSGNLVQTDVACYSYNGTNHRLLEEWDPRTVSSTCTFSSPVLPTQYTYTTAGKVASVTPPGLAAWSIAYGSVTGQVNNVHRIHSSTYGGATQQTSFVYNAPIGATSSANHPDLSASTVAGWGEYDVPVTATAVFPPGTSSSSTDLRAATVFGLDASGYEVNQAAFDGSIQADWDIATTQYDQYGNDVDDLTPLDRVSVTANSCSKAGLAGGCPQEILADGLSTVSKYSSDGSQLNKVFGPTSPSLMTAAGKTTVARPVSGYTYGTTSYPGTGINYAVDGPTGDLTQEVDGTSQGAASVITSETDQRTMTYAYGLDSTDSAGWDYGTPESATTTIAGGPNIVKETKIDDSTGLDSEVRQPSASGAPASPATTKYVYYSAGTTTDIANCVNTAWVGALCTTSPGSQPTTSGLPGLPVNQVTSYDYMLRPLTTVSTVTDASGAQQTITSTTTYDNGGIADRVSATSTTGGLGAVSPSQTYYYDTSTGLPTVESATSASSCSSTGPLCTGYDDFGNQTSFTDTTGATTTTTPNINDEPGSYVLKSPGGSTIQTATYTYASGNEHRDLLTSVNYSGGTGYSSVGTYSGTYNADGFLTSQTMPDGSTMTQTEDPEGNITQRVYDNTSTALFAEMDYLYNSFGQVAKASHADTENSTTYSYDGDGRLTEADDIYYNGQCTTRKYAFDVDSDRTSLNAYPPAAGGGCTSGTSPVTQTLDYDLADRLKSQDSAAGITYDAFGRITTLPNNLVTGGVTETMGYYNNDLINTLSQGGTTQTWSLDPADRYNTMTQSGSTVAIANHYSDLSDSPSWSSLTDLSGGTTTAVDDFDLAGGLAATTSDSASATHIHYQLTDPQGNVVGTADPTGTEIVTPLIADEYGNEQTLSGASATGPRYGWLGSYERDASSFGGIVLMGARQYLPQLGRFLSVDPVLGGCSGPYTYGFGDPVNASDVSGEAVCKGQTHTTQYPGGGPSMSVFQIYKDRKKHTWALRASIKTQYIPLAYDTVIRGHVYYTTYAGVRPVHKENANLRNPPEHWWTAHGALHSDPPSGTIIHFTASVTFTFIAGKAGPVENYDYFQWSCSMP